MSDESESRQDDSYFSANRQHWDDLVGEYTLGQSSEPVADFLDGETALLPVEREALGTVAGSDLLHLQCSIGLRTLSVAREGATVTGVDFSTEAIDAARHLASEAGLDDRATFLQSNVYDLPEDRDERYDIIYTSLGVLCWLPDLAAWAEIVARFLKPGGTFHLVEIHPIAESLSIDAEDGEPEIGVEHPYFTPEEPVATGDTADGEGEQSAENGSDAGPYKWSHGLGEILTALRDAGITLTAIDEYPFAAHEQFPGMVEDDDGYWHFEADIELPLLVTVAGRMEG